MPRRGKRRPRSAKRLRRLLTPFRFQEEGPMARKKPVDGEFVMFNVVYQDGTLSSNRKIPRQEIDQFEPDASAKAIIEAQDRKIAALSGRPRGPIKSISKLAGY
jgi:hypothetical protein